MVAVEKAGVPAVAIAARSFARAWQSCVDGWGQPNTAFVTIPHATTGQQVDFINKMVDEQIDAITQGMLGLTVACARCHDHKYDPISQQDYYQLAGVFLSSETLFGGTQYNRSMSSGG